MKLCKLVVLHARYTRAKFARAQTRQIVKKQSDVSPRPFVRFTSNFQGVLRVTRPSTSRKISALLLKMRLPRAF